MESLELDAAKFLQVHDAERGSWCSCDAKNRKVYERWASHSQFQCETEMEEETVGGRHVVGAHQVLHRIAEAWERTQILLHDTEGSGLDPFTASHATTLEMLEMLSESEKHQHEFMTHVRQIVEPAHMAWVQHQVERFSEAAKRNVASCLRRQGGQAFNQDSCGFGKWCILEPEKATQLYQLYAQCVHTHAPAAGGTTLDLSPGTGTGLCDNN